MAEERQQQGNPHRNQRRARQAEQEHADGLPEPNMNEVVSVPAKKQKEPMKGLGALAGYNFEGFINTVPDKGPHDEPAAGEGDNEDPALQELLDQMDLTGGDNAEDGHKEKDNMVTKTSTPDIPDISELRDLFADTERKKAERLAALKAEEERHEKMHASAPEMLALLDNKIIPARDAALAEKDMETANQLDQIIERARKNAEVDKALNERERQRQAAAVKAASIAFNDQMADLYADLPDDPEAGSYSDGTPRKLNSPTAALEATNKKGDSALLVVRFPAGTIVPTGKGGYAPTQHDEAAQLQITVDKVEGSGDTRHVFRQAEVTKETDGLHFSVVKAHHDAKPGVFNFIPPYFTRKDEQDRRNDPFDAVKYGIYLPHNREYNARRQEERFHDALSGAELTATQLLLEKAVGTMATEADWVFRTQDKREHPRRLKVVLRRVEQRGPVHVVAWGPPPANRFEPRLASLQPRRDDIFVPLTVEARVEENEGGVTSFVRFSTVDKALVYGEDERAKNVRAALRDLNMCLRQALLNEHAANAENQDEDDESHRRHYWRKDHTCRCGETEPTAVGSE